MENTIIKQTTIYRSNVTGLLGDEMGSGLAVQTDPPLETLNSWQVLQIAHAIKSAVNGIFLEMKEE